MYLATCCLLISTPVANATTPTRHSLANIEQAIKMFVHKQFPKPMQVSTLVNKLDRHLRLAKCPQILDVFYPTGSKKMGPTTVGVRCLSDSPWQIYVPIQVKVFGTAVVSKRSLLRGTFIDVSDLSIEKRELSSAMHGYFTSPQELVGMELRYSLAQGQIIGPKSLKPRHLVKRGDIVTILAETKGLLIQVKGKAMMNGFRGQSIRIKNTRSNRILQGEVVATRTVRIKL